MNRRLLAMSALMSASAHFRLLPPRPATCSSIASFTVLLCAALVLEDICAAPLCLPIFTWRTSVGSRQTAFLLRARCVITEHLAGRRKSPVWSTEATYLPGSTTGVPEGQSAALICAGAPV
jgi:hypothetical protein